jgi:hypothetical protein
MSLSVLSDKKESRLESNVYDLNFMADLILFLYNDIFISLQQVQLFLQLLQLPFPSTV